MASSGRRIVIAATNGGISELRDRHSRALRVIVLIEKENFNQTVLSDLRSLLPAKELDRICIEDSRQFLQHIDGSSVLFALQHANIVTVDPGTISNLFLRQIPHLSEPAQVDGDDLSQSHTRDVAGSLIYCHLIY